MDFSHLTIAVVGGDDREQEIARLAALTGATVRAYGFPWPEDGVEGVTLASTPEEALEGANDALFPIPGIGPDGSLFAPAAAAPIVPDRELLQRMKPGAAIILGWADDGLNAAAAELGIDTREYEWDVELMLLRGPAIVEGALQIAIEHSQVTIHNTDVLVVGHGNIGRLFARTLVQLGARVHLAARNPVQRADALSAGCIPLPLEELPELMPNVSMVFSTVPAAVVDKKLLAMLPPKSLVMDMSAPPGGIDLDAARELGHTAVWARGLGRRAPITVGASQWSGVSKRIQELEEERS